MSIIGDACAESSGLKALLLSLDPADAEPERCLMRVRAGLPKCVRAPLHVAELVGDALRGAFEAELVEHTERRHIPPP